MPKQQGTRTDLQPLPAAGNKLNYDAEVVPETPKPKLEVAAQMVIDDRTDAKIWILKNQLGRRNLIPPVRIKLALLVEDEIAAQAKKNSLANLKQNTELDICPTRATLNDSQKQDWRAKRETSTNNQLAKMAGVSDKTVQRLSGLSEI